MKLSSLIQFIDSVRVNGAPLDLKTGGGNLAVDPDIRSLHYRAQEVKAGGLFIAVPGHVRDGHDFIPIALENGAAAIVVQKPVQFEPPGLILQVENTRRAMASIAANFFNHPSRRMTLIGITGTNGKTTTAYLVEGLLQAAGYETGVIGTVNFRYRGRQSDNPVTTPESLDLQRILSDMRKAGVTHVVIEVSSHALDLHRVDECWFDLGVFTNLTQDHLDYHGDMQAYWACKQKLFTEILTTGPKRRRTAAVINCDDPKGRELSQLLSIPQITVGTQRGNSLRLESEEHSPSGINARIATPRGTLEVASALVGQHNRENILSAAGVGVALKLPIKAIKAGIEATTAIPGRLEPVPDPQGRLVFVDYAHTPDALKNVIASLEAIKRARLICVFGCGGDRDREKRPLMGEIAAGMCDLCVVTSDNPRSEPPMQIIDQILKGIQRVGSRLYRNDELTEGFRQKGYIVEPDRRKAIRLAISAAGPGDTVLIAGKGHETYQILAEGTIAFDDRQEARQALTGSSAILPEADG